MTTRSTSDMPDYSKYKMYNGMDPGKSISNLSLYVDKSLIADAGDGCFTRSLIKKGTRFGFDLNT